MTTTQPIIYEYQDEHGIVHWRKIRDDSKISNKNRRKSYSVEYIDDEGNVTDSWKNIQPPPFNLPRLLNAKEVYIVEGEKCAVALQELFDRNGLKDFCATTFCNGLANTKELLKRYGLFTDKNKVVICADNDEPGLRSASLIYDRLTTCGVKNAVRVDFTKKLNGENAPATYDIADMLEEISNLNKNEQLEKILEYVQTNGYSKSVTQVYSRSVIRRLVVQNNVL